MLPDSELLIQARSDLDALGVLFDRRAPAVHRYLARRLGPDAADDLLSEVFIRAAGSLRKVYGHATDSALPWLYGIARNVVREHLRRSGPRGERVVSVSGSDGVDWEAVDERLDAELVSAPLRQAMSELSAGEREILLLVSWEQLSVAEAALTLGITATAARSRLHRARARAAAALATTRHPFLDQEVQ